MMRCLVFLLTTMLVPLAHGTQCSLYNLQVCNEPVKDLQKDLKAPILHMDESTLGDFCNKRPGYVSCIDDLLPSCSTTVMKVIEGAKAGSEYLCGDGKEEYLEHRECFAQTHLNEEGKRCNRTLIHEIHAYGVTASKICKYSNEYVDCAVKAVTSTCGEDAGNWYRELMKLELDPTLKRIECAIDFGSINRADALLLLSAALLAVMVGGTK